METEPVFDLRRALSDAPEAPFDCDRRPEPEGPVTVEAPARLGETMFSGSCRVGAFTCFNHGVEVLAADFGRYGSINQRVLIGAGSQHTQFVTLHPIGSDPSGYSAAMHDSPAYMAAVANACAHPPAPARRTDIGHDVWIGAHAIVMQGVQIGTGAVIGVGAVVTRDVEPYEIVLGAPAHVVRRRFDADLCAELLASKWWEADLSALPVRDFSDPAAFLAELQRVGPPRLTPPTAQVGAGRP